MTEQDIPLEVLEIRMALPSNQPVLLLKDPNEDRVLRMWVGSGEATAIAMAQNNIQHDRPMTHELLITSLEAAGDPLRYVRIRDVDDELFYAELILRSGRAVDSRASDAIAAALVAQTPVYCAAAVMDEAGVEFPTGRLTPTDTESGLRADSTNTPIDPETAQRDVDEFRAFLENVSPEDFVDDAIDDSETKD